LRRKLAGVVAKARSRLLATGGIRGGIPFERGTLFYLLRNRFYIGEVRFKGEILPGEQPPIMDRALFDAVQQKLTDQWTTRSSVRNAGDHLLSGLLFDDAGHRMAPTHATKAGIRWARQGSNDDGQSTAEDGQSTAKAGPSRAPQRNREIMLTIAHR
jgi:hypothetical protein